MMYMHIVNYRTPFGGSYEEKGDFQADRERDLANNIKRCFCCSFGCNLRTGTQTKRGKKVMKNLP